MHSALRRGPRRVMLVLVSAAVIMVACSLSPLPLFDSRRSTPQPPIELNRCDDVQDVLCLVTFGLEPPDQMLILLLTRPGLPEELEMVVNRNDEKIPFACVTTAESPTVMYCTGPQIPLGTTVVIEVFAAEESILLASGEFTLTAFALPTVLAGGQEFPTPLPLTSRATRTTRPGSDSTSPPPFTTPVSTQTPARGFAYPNPTP